MPVTPDQAAPYAPASAILDLIERHRNRGLPPIVDADVLMRAGVSDSLVPRTLQALKVLDLLEEDGRPSDVMEAIRLAPTAEYEQRLGDWLRAAYADALTYVNPAEDDEVAIRDAFRKYVPTGQQGRMVSLFMGLFTAAGIMPSRQKSLQPKPSGSITGPRVLKLKRNVQQKSSISKTSAVVVSNPISLAAYSNSMPPAISGLLATLPLESGIWTKERRDQFLSTFGAVLDYTFRIGNPPELEQETATDQ